MGRAFHKLAVLEPGSSRQLQVWLICREVPDAHVGAGAFVLLAHTSAHLNHHGRDRAGVALL